MAKKPVVKIDKAAIRKLEKKVEKKFPDPLVLPGSGKNSEAAEVQKQMKRSKTPVSRAEALKIVESTRKGRK